MPTPLGWVRRAPAPLLRTSSTTERHVTSDELLRPDPVHAGARLRVRRAVGLHLARRRAQALQPRQARGLRVRHPAVAQAAGGGRVPIKYYLTAMLFIIFDIESVFLYPFAVAFNKLGLFALVEMVLFILTVFVAYAYVWRRGGLEWD